MSVLLALEVDDTLYAGTAQFLENIEGRVGISKQRKNYGGIPEDQLQRNNIRKVSDGFTLDESTYLEALRQPPCR